MHLISLIVCLVAGISSTLGYVLPEPGSEGHAYLESFAQSHEKRTLESSQQGQARANAVKEAFEFAWNGYFSKCKGHDELHPVSK